jgi:drug/metabolite transporter (DMT)-like permease
MERILSRPKSKYRAGLIVVEVIIAVIITYFLGGRTWSPTMWAIFAVVAAGIISTNLKYYRKKNRRTD